MNVNDEMNIEILCEIKLDADFKRKFPIAYGEKRKELIEEGCFTESNVETAMSEMVIELELYYQKGQGFFALESEAIGCTDTYSPYNREPMTTENITQTVPCYGKIRGKEMEKPNIFKETSNVFKALDERVDNLDFNGKVNFYNKSIGGSFIFTDIDSFKRDIAARLSAADVIDLMIDSDISDTPCNDFFLVEYAKDGKPLFCWIPSVNCDEETKLSVMRENLFNYFSRLCDKEADNGFAGMEEKHC